MPVVSELDILQQSLNDALNHFRDEMAELKLPLLSNGDTQRHPMDQAGFVDSPRLYEARRLILASLGELKNLIQNPFQKVIEKASGLYDAACLDIFVLTGIVDKLAEPCAIKEGLDAETLSKLLDLDKAKLVVIMRYLAADGWVLEIREERFRLCRPSLELLAGYGGRSWILYPIRANVARNLITQVSSDWKYSSESNKSAFQLAQNTSLSIWAWMEQHPAIREKYARAIQAFGDAFNQALTSDISWKRFDGWQFVDCAGGLGNLSISLAQILPKSRFIVQDQPEVVEYARQNFTKSAQELVDTGRIEAEAFDLFKIQPRTGDQIVYLLRLVLHDWPDKDSKEILRNIAASMSPSSRVFILEQIVQVRNPPELNVATAADLSELKNAGEFRSIVPPPYLPADLGAAGKTTTVLNMTMLATMNAHERTLRDWTSIISSVGLKVTEVHYTRGVLSGIECARFAF